MVHVKVLDVKRLDTLPMALSVAQNTGNPEVFARATVRVEYEAIVKSSLHRRTITTTAQRWRQATVTRSDLSRDRAMALAKQAAKVKAAAKAKAAAVSSATRISTRKVRELAGA